MHLNEFLPIRLTRLAASVAEAVTQVHARRFRLTRDEWRILSILGDAEARATRDVAELTALDKVSISRAASALEDRGLIRREEDRGDRRIKIMRATPQGVSLLAELERVMRAREAFLLEGVSAAERELLDTLIARLADRADALVAPETAHRCRPDCSGVCERAAQMLQAPEGPSPAIAARTPASASA